MATARALIGPPAASVLAGMLALLLGMLVGCGGGDAAAAHEPVRVAVAANFATPLDAVAEAFTQATGEPVVASLGSTGALYAQIRSGAPFDVLLAADQERPQRLEAEGVAVPGSRFTYARGQLALVGAALEGRTDHDLAAALRDPAVHHIAIANPATAPYGVAATEVLAALHLEQALQPELVRGENVAQTLQLVDTGAAELGLVALAQVIDRSQDQRWLVAAAMHAPIRQDAVLIHDRPAARAFLAFLRSAPAHAILERFGYLVED